MKKLHKKTLSDSPRSIEGSINSYLKSINDPEVWESSSYLIEANKIITKDHPKYLEVKFLLAKSYYNTYISMRTNILQAEKNKTKATLSAKDKAKLALFDKEQEWYEAAEHLEKFLAVFYTEPDLLPYSIIAGKNFNIKDFEKLYTTMHLEIIHIYNEILDDPQDKKVFYLEKLFAEYFNVLGDLDAFDFDYLTIIIENNKSKLKQSILVQLALLQK